MVRFNKKADGGLTAIVIIIIILVFIGWLVKIGNRECSTNNDCGSEKYCGSDFACHQIPVIEKSSTVVEYNLKAPAFIIGVAIVIAAIILRWNRIKPKGRKSTNGKLNDYTYYTNY